MGDVFAIQDEISRAITAALMPNLAAERPGMLVKPYTGSVDAYELCLRARYHHQKRTPAGLGMALRLFEQAIARDPNCALAHAGIAHVCLITSYFGGMPTREGMTRMKAAALRAVELDEALAVAHVRLADAFCFKDWDWAGAEREFLRARDGADTGCSSGRGSAMRRRSLSCGGPSRSTRSRWIRTGSLAGPAYRRANSTRPSSWPAGC
jgi:serine/threonine-protein kinase